MKWNLQTAEAAEQAAIENIVKPCKRDAALLEKLFQSRAERFLAVPLSEWEAAKAELGAPELGQARTMSALAGNLAFQFKLVQVFEHGDY